MATNWPINYGRKTHILEDCTPVVLNVRQHRILTCTLGNEHLVPVRVTLFRIHMFSKIPMSPELKRPFQFETFKNVIEHSDREESHLVPPNGHLVLSNYIQTQPLM